LPGPIVGGDTAPTGSVESDRGLAEEAGFGLSCGPRHFHLYKSKQMKTRSLLSSALIGAVASARSMTPMATIAAARLLHRDTPGELMLLDRPLFKYGALAMGIGELAGDKMASAPDRTVFLGLLARAMSAGIAGAALAPRGRERAGAVVAVATAVPLAYLTLAGRKRAMARIGQTRSGLIEDALMVAAGAAVVALSTQPDDVDRSSAGERKPAAQAGTARQR
jgi:uncharacterized membrane protein